MEPTDTEILDVRSVGADTVAIDIATPDEFDAQPGQFVKLSATLEGEETSRFYTISSPTVSTEFEIIVEIDPEGTLGPWLADSSVGDSVTLEGPFGNNFYEGESEVLILAGGPGVGPAIGIAEHTLGEGGDAAVVYCDEDPILEDRLDAARENGAFVSVVENEAELTDPVADALTEDTQVFVYGFAEFLDTATSVISNSGGTPEDAKVENFG